MKIGCNLTFLCAVKNRLLDSERSDDKMCNNNGKLC